MNTITDKAGRDPYPQATRADPPRHLADIQKRIAVLAEEANELSASATDVVARLIGSDTPEQDARLKENVPVDGFWAASAVADLERIFTNLNRTRRQLDRIRESLG